MNTIRILTASEGQAYRSLRLRALQDSPEAFCSTHAEEAARPASSWDERLQRAATLGQDLPLFYMSGDQPVGMLWAKIDADNPSNVTLYQMWVAPEARGKGVAQALLEHAGAWARSKGALTLSLGVKGGETPAYRLYAKVGFIPVSARDPGQEFQDMQLTLQPSGA